MKQEVLVWGKAKGGFPSFLPTEALCFLRHRAEPHEAQQQRALCPRLCSLRAVGSCKVWGCFCVCVIFIYFFKDATSASHFQTYSHFPSSKPLSRWLIPTSGGVQAAPSQQAVTPGGCVTPPSLIVMPSVPGCCCQAQLLPSRAFLLSLRSIQKEQPVAFRSPLQGTN